MKGCQGEAPYRVIYLYDKTPVKVDPENYPWLNEYKWSKTSTGYARTGKRSRRMHRMVMGEPKGKDVDHMNGDIYDNRKANLRVCSRRENSRNHNAAGGTRLSYGAWRARIKVDYKELHLGTYATEAEATAAYRSAAAYYFGEFARHEAQPKSADELRRKALAKRCGKRLQIVEGAG